MPYHQLFYHFVWSTNGREPLLNSEIEPIVYNLIRRKAAQLGAQIFALNGAEDHVHLVVSLPPVLAPAIFAGQVKGASSCRFNKTYRQYPVSRWQKDYGVLSFSRKALPQHVRYVQRQKIHHANRRRR